MLTAGEESPSPRKKTENIMFLTIAQIISLTVAIVSVVAFAGLIALSRAWKVAMVSNAHKQGRKHPSHEQDMRYDRVFVPVGKSLLPIIWAGAAGLTIWAVIRIVLSFTN